MEEILNEVKTYDIAKLRQKLTENGVDVGPIGPSSMYLFQRSLARKLYESRGGRLEEHNEDTDTKTPDIAVSERSESNNVSTQKLPDVFYAVCLPENVDPQVKNEVKQLVFSDKDLALKTAKKVKNARFKVFKLESEAQEFSKLTAESAFSSPRKPDNAKEDTKETEKQMPVESSPYKSPRPHEIVEMRKTIEGGNVESFQKCVWENPRYLVGNGDTPVIYQEGFRYTAMHVAALKNKPEVCQVILDTIENPDFIQQLYSQSRHTEETQNNRINFLVDLYLNMPDKGNCESPLHMACKFGHDKVVEKLTAHPTTDRKLKNKWGDSPRDVICSRCKDASTSLKERIEMLLEGQSYVPLLRSDDNSTVPVIGKPWSPDKNSPLQKVDRTWSPKDPSMSVKAYAGPMSPSNARTFYKKWTTPPPQSPDKAKIYFDIKRSDSEKGLERIGRQLAHEMKIPWLEYWEFLNAYVDLSCDTGLELLEKYFQKMIWLEFVKEFKDKYVMDSEAINFSTPVKQDRRENDVEKSASQELKSERNDKVKEGTGCDIFKELENAEIEKKENAVVSPMTSLAQSFAQITLLDESWSDKATVYSTDKSVIDDGTDTERGVKSKFSYNNNVTAVLNDITVKQVNGCLSESSNSCDKFKNTDEKDDRLEKESCKSDSGTSVNAENCTLENSNVSSPKTGDTTDTKHQKSSSSEEKLPVSDTTDDESHIINQSNKLELIVNNDSENPSLSRIEYNKYLSEESDTHLSKTVDTRNTSIGEKTKSEHTVIPVLPSDEFCKTDHEKVLDTDDSVLFKKSDLLKQRSCSSESNDSFKTSTEEVEDADGAAFHDLDEPEKYVCINVSDINIVSRLKDHKNKVVGCSVKFVARLKSIASNAGLKIDIISVPGDGVITCSELLVLEDIDVSSCEGDLGGTAEGDIVEIGTGNRSDSSIENVVYAHISRSVTLPKVAYLHGPQPTREDLDVSRALGDVVIVPDLYPNVFHWKIRVSRFLKDTSYRWQSPAKLRSKQLQGSPQPAPLRRSSPVIQYGSPLGIQSQSRITPSSDIRTRLFPAIAE